MSEPVIVGCARTPIGAYLGSLREVEPYKLAAGVLNRALGEIGLDSGEVDQVIMGQSYQNGENVNIARMALLYAGWPEAIPGFTLDSRCCTGLDTVRMASSLIQSGVCEVIAVCGVENMSQAEFYVPGNNIKWELGGKGSMPRGHGDINMWGIPFYDRIQRARVMSQPIDRYGTLPSMMSWAETAASELGVTREECDAWALQSHRKACRAIDEGRFEEEIVPFTVQKSKKESYEFSVDETPRRDSSLEKLQKLTPVQNGVCTAGNSSSENDAAACVVLMSREAAKKRDVTPLAKPRAFGFVGADPRRTHETVPLAIAEALRNSDLSLKDMDLIEIQEAFAAQVLADLKMLELGQEEHDRINVNGSGISLGHPIACTGTRVLVTLVREMRRRGVRYGLESICGGGGLGIAAVLESF